MAAVHCSILHCMCEAIAGIGVETHDLTHPLPTLRVDCTPCTNLYFKWMHCPCTTSTLGIPQFKSKLVVFALFFIMAFRHVLFPWACELNPDHCLGGRRPYHSIRSRARPTDHCDLWWGGQAGTIASSVTSMSNWTFQSKATLCTSSLALGAGTDNTLP